METFYRFLGGPRTFWGGGNKTIINNNFIGTMPYSYGFGHTMPMFGGHHCCGGVPNAFKWMLGFGLASSLVGGIMNSVSQPNNTNVNSYNPYQSYNPYLNNPYNNNYNNYYNYSNQDLSSLTAKVNKLEDELESYKKTLDELTSEKREITEVPSSKKEEVKSENNVKKENDTQQKNTAGETVKQEENIAQQTPTEVQETKKEEKNTNTTNNTVTENNNVSTTENADIKDQTATSAAQEKKDPKTLDEILNEVGYNNLDNAAKNYVKSRISEVYTDENGNIKYDIKAVVHDGDNLNSIIDRFYTSEEKDNLEVAKAKLHTQGSETKLIVNPLSGDTIVAKGVSEYGLKALIQDAQKGITRQGEITKTNKRISDLKTAFINGEKKLSKAYVIQNKLMTEAEYNKIIQEKYS